MGGNKSNAQPFGGQHHHHLRAFGLLGKKFGVARKGQAAVVDDPFMHRASNERGKVAIKRPLGRLAQGFDHIGAVGALKLARGYRLAAIDLQ